MPTPKRLLRALDERDGHRCAWHAEGECPPDHLVPHHRSNRGMGGSPSKNTLANLIWLDSEMNGLIESDATLAVEARRRGIKISIHANPQHEPIVHAVHGKCLLGDDGSVEANARVVF